MAGSALAAIGLAVGPEVLKALVPKLSPILQGLIHRVQDIFGPDKGTGQQNDQKQGTVLAMGLAALTELIKTGQVPALPDGAANPIVTMLIELLVRQEKENGKLPASAPAVPTIAGLGPATPMQPQGVSPWPAGTKLTFEVVVK